MIQANELRIGNLVKTYEYPEGNLVTSITENYIDLKGSNIIPIQRIEGINITFELLEKAGFVKLRTITFGRTIYEKGKIYYCQINGKKEIRIGELIIPNVEYFHQLQNIYYILAGKELEFNQ